MQGKLQLDIVLNMMTVVIPTYRNVARALRAAELLSLQSLPPGMECEVIIVDDGSDDDTRTLFAALPKGHVRVVSLHSNQGRSAARNAGAHEAKGDCILFLDSDCVPASPFLLFEHIKSLRQGAIVSLGHITGVGEGFWSRYQHEASMRRERQHGLGVLGTGSSANFAVLKAAFLSSGGFDPAYVHYGFEDRDLFLRLAPLGPVCWSTNAVVQHLDSLHLGSVATKMAEAGQFSAARFSARHREAYRDLGYSAIDARWHPSLRPLGYLLGPVVQRIADKLETLLTRRWMPYPLARAIVKAVTGVSFLYGTTRTMASKAPT